MTKDEEPWARELHKATIAGEVKELKAKIEEYEALRFGTAPVPQLLVLKDIPRMLIQRRVGLGWTQEDLANRLGVRPQQVQHDEANNYASASLARLTKVARILQRAKKKSRAQATTKAEAPRKKTATR